MPRAARRLTVELVQIETLLNRHWVLRQWVLDNVSADKRSRQWVLDNVSVRQWVLYAYLSAETLGLNYLDAADSFSGYLNI